MLRALGDHRRIEAGIADEVAKRLFEGTLDDREADILVMGERRPVVADKHRNRADQRHPAARHDALFDRRAGRRERVLHPMLLLLHLDLGRRADVYHRNAAGKLRQPLLQLLAVIVGGRILDL